MAIALSLDALLLNRKGCLSLVFMLRAHWQ